jgi:hypothetical protein
MGVEGHLLLMPAGKAWSVNDGAKDSSHLTWPVVMLMRAIHSVCHTLAHNSPSMISNCKTAWVEKQVSIIHAQKARHPYPALFSARQH